MKQTVKINTIDELIAAAIKDSTRFTIEEDSNWVYDDPVAAKAWQDGEDGYCGKWIPYGAEGYEEYRKKVDSYQDLRPSRHIEKTYRLRNNYSTYYILSEEVGSQVDAIWTKHPSRYSNRMVNKGSMTLAGMLKRMGHDISGQIEAQKTKRELANQIYIRNNARLSLKRKLEDLEKWVTDYGGTIDVTAEMFQLPIELAEKLEPEAMPE